MGEEKRETVLCIDLDGSLLKTDLLYESFAALLRTNPLEVIRFPSWLLGGKARLKAELAKRMSFDPGRLPYNERVLEYLHREKARGRRLVLATASDRRFATLVAEHLGVFDEVVASDGSRNLKGKLKSDLLVDRFGEKGFDYVGDSIADRVIWERAAQCILVSRDKGALKRMGNKVVIAEELFSPRAPAVFFRALRVHQWVKNLLVFVPLVMAHQLGDADRVLKALLAFLAFSLCASAVYLMNDLADLDADRLHPTKRHRPIASGDLGIPFAIGLAPVLLLMSGALALFTSAGFGVLLGLYFALTSAYSFALKKIAILDIVVLASLYTLRVLAGGRAVDVPVSPWLLGFSMFLFFSLACMKRYSELLSLRKKNEELAAGRGYRASDLDQVASFGAASGYMAVLVMALYVNSGEVTRLYTKPQALWVICPLLLFWISRTWLIAHRGEMHEDPIVFAIRDRTSYLVGFLCAAILWVAM
ncbi:MAG: UbiA family prenyltransferase [Gammaproteobacteria bacterium]